jgi:hypothetical protein
MRFITEPVNELSAFGTTDVETGTLSISVNLRYETGAIGRMMLGIGPVLEAMVFVKGTNNQAI